MQSRLELSPPDEAQRAEAKEAKAAAYRRQYWQQYKQDHKRVYGTLSVTEYKAMKAIADQNDRAVWEQIWAESKAYRRQEYLPTMQLSREIERLYVELRRIGNNLNQIAALGHTYKGSIDLAEVSKFLKSLEASIAAFVSRPWRSRSAAKPGQKLKP